MRSIYGKIFKSLGEKLAKLCAIQETHVEKVDGTSPEFSWRLGFGRSEFVDGDSGLCGHGAQLHQATSLSCAKVLRFKTSVIAVGEKCWRRKLTRSLARRSVLTTGDGSPSWLSGARTRFAVCQARFKSLAQTCRDVKRC